jgi:hypothetical protein
MMGNSVRPAGATPCARTFGPEAAPQELVTAQAQAPLPKKSFTQRIETRAKGLFGR